MRQELPTRLAVGQPASWRRTRQPTGLWSRQQHTLAWREPPAGLSVEAPAPDPSPAPVPGPRLEWDPPERPPEALRGVPLNPENLQPHWVPGTPTLLSSGARDPRLSPHRGRRLFPPQPCALPRVLTAV